MKTRITPRSLVVFATACVHFALMAGNAYYVDPNAGSNSYDGTAAVPEGGGSSVGPKKTLAGAMAISGLTAGDVVYAAEGSYIEGNSSDSYRVKIPSGVSLVASGKAENTFIVGAADDTVTADASPWGCGSKALRCVYMAANTRLECFTVCGGRALGVEDNKYGGGIIADNSNNVVVVDCIISNNVAGRSAGLYGGIAVRCEFMENRAVKTGPHVMRASLYNCYLHDALGGDIYPVYQCTMRNCRLNGGVNSSFVFNSYVSNDRSGNKFHFSAYPSKHSNSTAVTNCFTATTAAMAIDENRRPIKGSNSGIDKGSYYYYTNGMPSVVAKLLDVDFRKGQRVHNGEIDIGCGEYDSRGDLAYSLAHSYNFEATDETFGVKSTTAGTVTIPGGDEMSGTWTPPDAAKQLCYGFKASVSDDAVLHVYRDGVEIACVAAADGVKAIGYVTAGAHSLRFACEGNGVATISSFKSMLGRAWYVDANRGDNAYDGTAALPEGGESTVGPKKTLAGAMAISGLASGDVVHVAEGRYDEGEMAPVSGAACGITTNRVVVKAGVGLLADAGPERTFIVGRKPSGGGNFGSDAMRCVYLNEGAWIYGFTITNGATCSNGSYGDYGGGVSSASGGCAANCRFAGNSARRGGAAYGGWYVGCRFGENNLANESSGIYDCQGVFNSDFYNCKPYGKWTLCNCTFRGVSPQGNGFQNVYNCFMAQESTKNCNFYNCILTGRHAGQDNPDGATRFNVTDAYFDSDTVRPTTNSSLVDAGIRSYYDDNFPADWAIFKTLDLSGGQRVYNDGKIDVGAGEYDWRAAFARILHPTRASVASATEGVKAGDGAVLLGDGDMLVVDWTVAGGTTELRTVLSGAGAATVTLDGEPLEIDASGVTRFSAADGQHRLVFSFAGGGTFAVTKLKCTLGTILFVR